MYIGSSNPFPCLDSRNLFVLTIIVLVKFVQVSRYLIVRVCVPIVHPNSYTMSFIYNGEMSAKTSNLQSRLLYHIKYLNVVVFSKTQ